MKQPYKQFDIPTGQLEVRGPHYELPYGRGVGALYTQERRGASLARTVTERLSSQEIDDGNYTSRLIAAAAFNSAWYNYNEVDSAMRHLIKLPVMVDEDGNNRKDAGVLLSDAGEFLSAALVRQHRAIELATAQKPIRARLRFEIGRSLGGASLSLSALDIAKTVSSMERFEAQEQARYAALELAESARELGRTIGAYPSLAQLGTESSELMLHLRRKAPVDAVEIIDDAAAALELETGLGER